jgi:glucan phosphoethanolaminetransferase (alkaline phosphatase superfamily)
MVKSVVFTLQRRAWAAVAALVALLMLPNLMWLYVGHGLVTWVSGLLIPALLLTILFALLGKRIWLACLLLAPFAMLAPIEATYIATYLHPTNSEILATLIATNPREAQEYLGSSLLPIVATVFIALLLALAAALWSKQASIRWQNRFRVWAIAAAVVLPLAAGTASMARADGNTSQRFRAATDLFGGLSDSIEPGYPFGLFQRISEYRRDWQQMRIDASRLDAFRFHAQGSPILGKREVYVLVIGESSRRDHWQLFGYPRGTNPELTKILNLVPVADMVTSWPASLLAIPLTITRKPTSDSSLVWKEASILRAMSEAGFDTYWISNQLPMGKYDSPVSTSAYEAQHTSFLNHASWSAPGSYDEVLMQGLRDALQDSHKNLFVVLHMMGSHTGYEFRYPSAFKQFRPVLSDPDGNGSRNDRIRNSYDNTILYTDHVLAGIIDILRTSGTVSSLLYESDHGEDLPTATCALSGHGNGTPYDFQIPAFLWYSDGYADAFPQRIAAFRNNATQRVLSAGTFESLIDMAGVTFPGHDLSWSLFSTQWRFHPRIVNGIWKTDIDHADYGKQCKLLLPQ